MGIGRQVKNLTIVSTVVLSTAFLTASAREVEKNWFQHFRNGEFSQGFNKLGRDVGDSTKCMLENAGKTEHYYLEKDRMDFNQFANECVPLGYNFYLWFKRFQPTWSPD